MALAELSAAIQLHCSFKQRNRALAGTWRAQKLPSNVRGPQVTENQEAKTCVRVRQQVGSRALDV